MLFNFKENITIEKRTVSYQEAYAKVSSFITQERRDKIDKVLEGRTCNIGVLCERIHDTGNIAAVIRSMENLGFQNLDVIMSEKMKISTRITNGADKWISQRNWKNTTDCVEQLKSEGYQIVATSLQADSVPMTEIDFTKPTVIALGNEKEGVSEELLALTDKNCIIPTVGFSQSFNISVAAAILLSYIKIQREQKQGFHGDLTERQKEIMRSHFYLKSLKNPHKYFQ